MNKLQICIGAAFVLVSGCRDQRFVEVGVWSKPEEVAKSSDSLSASFGLYKWNGSLMTLGGDAGTFATRILQEEGKNWRDVSKIDPGWIPMNVDPQTNRIVVSRGILTSDSVEVSFTTCAISADGRYVTKTNNPIVLDKKKLFGTSDQNLRMTYGGDRPVQIAFAGGTMEGTRIYVPYCIEGIRWQGNTIIANDTVGANGVFSSSDAGRTWLTEQISNYYSENPVVCRTKEFLYYFATGSLEPYELWSSRSPASGGSWTPSETLIKTFAHILSVPSLRALAEDDTVHLCWLDNRHEKKRLNPFAPALDSFEVIYRSRKDSDASWSKDVILSEGLLYAYAPSMSAEGNNIVVAWAGVKSDKVGRNEFDPSDIFYVTSKDGGKTWTKPLQVTDGFKDGITSGRPQVALHKDVIHLFYIQGKLDYKKTGGAVKLNQPPWPILYQQRPFLK